MRQAACWSVFAGAAGLTYGHVNVWIFNDPDDTPEGLFDVVMDHQLKWQIEIGSVGAEDMRHLIDLMMSRPHQGRVLDQGLLARPLAEPKKPRATRGQGYALVYGTHGDPIEIHLGRIPWTNKKCWWYDPRTGRATLIKTTSSVADATFDPPGKARRGNDYVLVIDDADRGWSAPGTRRGGS